MIKFFKEFKEEQSDVICTLLTLDLMEATFLSESDVDDYMEDIEIKYGSTLMQNDYLYILDLCFEKLDGIEMYDEDE